MEKNRKFAHTLKNIDFPYMQEGTTLKQWGWMTLVVISHQLNEQRLIKNNNNTNAEKEISKGSVEK
jgi:hypothetical protein